VFSLAFHEHNTDVEVNVRLGLFSQY